MGASERERERKGEIPLDKKAGRKRGSERDLARVRERASERRSKKNIGEKNQTFIHS